jgi:hypothetical protein
LQAIFVLEILKIMEKFIGKCIFNFKFILIFYCSHSCDLSLKKLVNTFSLYFASVEFSEAKVGFY